VISHPEENLRTASILIDQGHYRQAEKLLIPLFEQKVPEAAYLLSRFAQTKESEQHFELRRSWLLHQAASWGNPEAQYTLGVAHERGDGVIKSATIASAYFQHAAERGHVRAKLSHGLDLVHGTNGIARNRLRGIEYLKAAQSAGVEGADEALQGIKEEPGKTA